MSTSSDYEIMRNAIQNNIEAIRCLLKDADDLSDAIDAISDNETLKTQLKDHVKSLHDSIDHLVVETNKLFKQYIELANSVATS